MAMSLRSRAVRPPGCFGVKQVAKTFLLVICLDNEACFTEMVPNEIIVGRLFPFMENPFWFKHDRRCLFWLVSYLGTLKSKGNRSVNAREGFIESEPSAIETVLGSGNGLVK